MTSQPSPLKKSTAGRTAFSRSSSLAVKNECSIKLISSGSGRETSLQSEANFSFRSRVYLWDTVAFVASSPIFLERLASAAGLIAGTVPTKGVSGNLFRRASRAVTEIVLQATTISPGAQHFMIFSAAPQAHSIISYLQHKRSLNQDFFSINAGDKEARLHQNPKMQNQLPYFRIINV